MASDSSNGFWKALLAATLAGTLATVAATHLGYGPKPAWMTGAPDQKKGISETTTEANDADPNATSQVVFIGPDGMRIQWDVGVNEMFDSEPLIAPTRHNFSQSAIHRLKLSGIPGRPGVE